MRRVQNVNRIKIVRMPDAHLDAHGLQVHGVAHLAHAARRGEQRFAGHAAAVDAGAANVVALNHRDLHALLHRVHRRAVAADAAADDDEVIVVAGRRGARRGAAAAGAGAPGGLYARWLPARRAGAVNVRAPQTNKFTSLGRACCGAC